eukprot:4967607-Amphidinium_carterae.1
MAPRHRSSQRLLEEQVHRYHAFYLVLVGIAARSILCHENPWSCALEKGFGNATSLSCLDMRQIRSAPPHQASRCQRQLAKAGTVRTSPRITSRTCASSKQCSVAVRVHSPDAEDSIGKTSPGFEYTPARLKSDPSWSFGKAPARPHPGCLWIFCSLFATGQLCFACPDIDTS